MERSIEVWISQAVGQVTPALKLWAERHPLPIGEVAARRLYTEGGQKYPDELTGFLPFQGPEEAYWALRVQKNRSVLDMFGLKGPKLWVPPGSGPGEDTIGGFRYSLRGYDDTSLVELVRAGERWWTDRSLAPVQGRPPGTGIFESEAHAERAMRSAAQELRAQGRNVTQEAVAELFQTSDRIVRHWLKRCGFASWREFLKTL